MKKQKLVLRKTVIASLSDAQKAKIIGGDGTDDYGYTTSHNACTGIFCCDPDTKVSACSPETCAATCPATCPDTCVNCETGDLLDPLCSRTC